MSPTPQLENKLTAGEAVVMDLDSAIEGV